MPSEAIVKTLQNKGVSGRAQGLVAGVLTDATHTVRLHSMESPVTAALANALGKLAKKGRSDLAAGEHELDATVTLHVTGTVKVGEDEDYIPTASIPLKATLALFMRYAGVTGPVAMKALVKAMNEAHAISLLSDKEKKTRLEAIREIADLDEAEVAVNKQLGALDEKTRVGKVNVKVVVEEVESIKPMVKVEAAEAVEEVA